VRTNAEGKIGDEDLTVMDNTKRSFPFLDSTKNEESFEMTEERSRQWLKSSEGFLQQAGAIITHILETGSPQYGI
jgi:hypothetical protein